MKFRIMFTLGASLIGFFLPGCRKPVAVSDVQGAWLAKKASQQKWTNGTNSCQMLLRADGTFTASVPDHMMVTFDKASGKIISGKGKWRLQPPKALAPIGIELTFSEVDGERRNSTISNTLQAERGKQGVELFFYVREEGGERFVFEQAFSQAAQTVEK